MNQEGLTNISEALQDFNASITPSALQPHQNVRYVSIETDPPVAPAEVLNALDGVRLME